MPADSLSLTLHKPAVEAVTAHSWPMKVTVVSTVTGLSAKIFVYHSMTGATEFSGDVFECVASLGQMVSLPEDAPAPPDGTDNTPYYRKDTCELICTSADEMDELWATIQEDAQSLLNNYRASLTFAETTTVDLA